MGTLTVTYNNKSTDYTMSGAPAVTYNGGIIGSMSASGWSGSKTLKCAGKWMKSDVKIGSSLVLKTYGKRAKSDIKLTYTPNTAIYYPDAITTGGPFTVPEGYNRIQFFLVGGGASGSKNWWVDAGHWTYEDDDGNVYETSNADRYGNGGGGGGYTATSEVFETSGNAIFVINIGRGGQSGAAGETTSVTSNGKVIASAAGGQPSDGTYGRWYWAGGVGDYRSYRGGNGGSGGGAGYVRTTTKSPSYVVAANGGTNGGDGSNITAQSYWNTSVTVGGGTGQGNSTQNNWNANGTVITYAGGGGGGGAFTSQAGWTNFKNSSGGDGGGGKGAGSMFQNLRNCKAVSGTDGTFGTGGGGGGSAYGGGENPYNLGTKWWQVDSSTPTSDSDSMNVKGGDGGSGVVIIKLWEE